MSVNEKFKWYTVQTYTSQESRAASYIQEFIDNGDLEGLIAGVLSPTRDVVTMRNGKRVTVTRKDFPGYILVQMNLSDDTAKRQAMHFVQNVNGVMGFVGGQSPRSLKKSEIDRILGRENEVSAKEITEVPFEIGDAVKVNSGPFKDFDGVVSKILPASAATFALVPRDISSGEFTKLAQRFYVRIRFNKLPKDVKVGMSGEVKIEKCNK